MKTIFNYKNQPLTLNLFRTCINAFETKKNSVLFIYTEEKYEARVLYEFNIL